MTDFTVILLGVVLVVGIAWFFLDQRKTGTFGFACGMGMVHGKIEVIE